MTPERLEEEIALLETRFERVEYQENGLWFLVDPFRVPDGWSREWAPCSFRVAVGYPGTPPYAFYVPAALRPNCGSIPGNYQPSPNPQPPFEGDWGMLSWSHEAGGWRPGADVRTGSNLLNYVLSFSDRFRQGA